MENKSSYIIGVNIKDQLGEIRKNLLELRKVRLQEGKPVNDIDGLLNDM